MASLPTSGVDLKANLGPTVPRTVVPVAVLATIAVACRLYSRKLKNLQFAAHDYLIIGGLVLAWGCAAITIISRERLLRSTFLSFSALSVPD